MKPIIENRFLQLIIDAQAVRWSLAARAPGCPSIYEASSALTYRINHQTRDLFSRGLSISAAEEVPSPHGILHQVVLSSGPDGNGVIGSLRFALPDAYPFLLVQLQIENSGQSPVEVERFDVLRPQPGKNGSLRDLSADSFFFSNGWQSWSFTGLYRPQDRSRRTRLGPFRRPTDANPGTPQPSRPGVFGSDMFGLLGDRRSRRALLAGFLSQCEQFGSLEARLETDVLSLSLWANGDGVRLDPGRSIHTDWACLHPLHLDDSDPLGPYVEAVAREHGLAQPFPPDRPIPSGWCSWYQFSTADYAGDVTAQNVRHNLNALSQLRSRLPMDLVQIDDGFQAQIGDWLKFSPGFPDGVAPLAQAIRSHGFTPGLWLAPLIVHPASEHAADHPDWLLRTPSGKPVNAGYLWKSFANPLDMTHPGAQDYVRQVVDTAVHRWGFPYLKLDFLYAGALPGAHQDPTVSRAQVLHHSLQIIREAAGEDAFLLGCGCPLGPAIGLVDAMRIGADTGRSWRPAFRGIQTFLRKEANLPSAENALHNTLTRLPLHRRWWINDPDCLLLRPQTHLNLDEVQTAATVIALSGGSLLLSDHLPDLPPDRLKIAQVLLPLIGQPARILDLFASSTPSRILLELENSTGKWLLIALINWEDTPQDSILIVHEAAELGETPLAAREFWSGSFHVLHGGTLPVRQIPPHSCALFTVRKLPAGLPVYLGGDLHISQGLEVTSWEAGEQELSFRLERPGQCDGRIELWLPHQPRHIILNGEKTTFHPLEMSRYSVPVHFQDEARIKIYSI